MARERSGDFCKMFAHTLVPRDLDIADSTLSDLTYAEIEAKLLEQVELYRQRREENGNGRDREPSPSIN